MSRLSKHPSSPEELAETWDISLKAAKQVWQPDYDDPEFIRNNWYILIGNEVLSLAEIEERGIPLHEHVHEALFPSEDMY